MSSRPSSRAQNDGSASESASRANAAEGETTNLVAIHRSRIVSCREKLSREPPDTRSLYLKLDSGKFRPIGVTDHSVAEELIVDALNLFPKEKRTLTKSKTIPGVCTLIWGHTMQANAIHPRMAQSFHQRISRVSLRLTTKFVCELQSRDVLDTAFFKTEFLKANSHWGPHQDTAYKTFLDVVIFPSASMGRGNNGRRAYASLRDANISDDDWGLISGGYMRDTEASLPVVLRKNPPSSAMGASVQSDYQVHDWIPSFALVGTPYTVEIDSEARPDNCAFWDNFGTFITDFQRGNSSTVNIHSNDVLQVFFNKRQCWTCINPREIVRIIDYRISVNDHLFNWEHSACDSAKSIMRTIVTSARLLHDMLEWYHFDKPNFVNIRDTSSSSSRADTSSVIDYADDNGDLNFLDSINVGVFGLLNQSNEVDEVHVGSILSMPSAEATTSAEATSTSPTSTAPVVGSSADFVPSVANPPVPPLVVDTSVGGVASVIVSSNVAPEASVVSAIFPSSGVLDIEAQAANIIAGVNAMKLHALQARVVDQAEHEEFIVSKAAHSLSLLRDRFTLIQENARSCYQKNMFLKEMSTILADINSGEAQSERIRDENCKAVSAIEEKNRQVQDMELRRIAIAGELQDIEGRKRQLERDALAIDKEITAKKSRKDALTSELLKIKSGMKAVEEDIRNFNRRKEELASRFTAQALKECSFKTMLLNLPESMKNELAKLGQAVDTSELPSLHPDNMLASIQRIYGAQDSVNSTGRDTDLTMGSGGGGSPPLGRVAHESGSGGGGGGAAPT